MFLLYLLSLKKTSISKELVSQEHLIVVFNYKLVINIRNLIFINYARNDVFLSNKHVL